MIDPAHFTTVSSIGVERLSSFRLPIGDVRADDLLLLERLLPCCFDTWQDEKQ